MSTGLKNVVGNPSFRWVPEMKKNKKGLVLSYAILRLICISATIAASAAMRLAPMAA
jgi:hypothetical protein